MNRFSSMRKSRWLSYALLFSATVSGSLLLSSEHAHATGCTADFCAEQALNNCESACFGWGGLQTYFCLPGQSNYACVCRLTVIGLPC